MGEVWRARDTNLGRDVAVKVLPDAFAHDAERLARFEREAKTLASFNHPNIAGIYGLERTDPSAGSGHGGTRALVMELVDGPTLADRIARGPVSVDETQSIARQIADALEAAHEHGIVHRDLKPANIKVRDDGTVKVLDFGLAKALDASHTSPDMSHSPTITSPAMTQLGVILGTAAYMSPEQARGKAVDKRADIWAFGCVLFEMLTGKRAFEGDDVAEVLASVLAREPDWTRLPRNLSPSAVTYLKRCLHKDPRQRIRDVQDVRLALDGAFDAKDVAFDSVPARRSVWPSVVLLILTLLVVAALGGAAVWHFRPGVGPSQQPVTRFSFAAPSDVGPQGAGTGRHLFAFSPLGTHLVYWTNNQLYLRRMDQLAEGIPIRGTENAREPFFSSDGQQIGFHADNQFKRVPVGGGTPVPVTKALNPWGASWDADDVIRYGQGPEGIWQVPAAGGTPQQIIPLAKGEFAHGPQLLPGGEWMLFTLRPAGTGSWDEAQIVVQSLRTRERIVLTAGRDARYVPTGHLVYGAAGTLFAVAFDLDNRRLVGGPVALAESVMDADFRSGAMHYRTSTNGTLVYLAGLSGDRRTLSWRTREGNDTALRATPQSYREPRVAPDGTKVAVDLGNRGQLDVRVYDIARDSLDRLTVGAAMGRYPLWTPDARQVVFYSEAEGGGLFLKSADGAGNAERLTTSATDQVPYSWSHDGRTLIFEQRGPAPGDGTGGAVDVYTLILDGATRVATPLLNSINREAEPAVSADGRWLAYTEQSLGRTRNVYVSPFPRVEGGRWPISTDGGFAPLWSPNGKELYFISPRAEAMAVPIETEPVFRPGIPTKMFDLPPYYLQGQMTFTRQWDHARDGRFLLINPGAPAAGDDAVRPQIVVVLNWLDELKRLVPVN